MDLDQGTEVSSVPKMPGIATYAPDLISTGGKLLLAGQGEAQITYTELPTGLKREVNDQVLTDDGSKTISLLKDGSLQLRPAGADNDRLLAEASPQPHGDPPENHLRLSRDGSLIADREAVNVVTVRETSTLRANDADHHGHAAQSPADGRR